MYAMINNNMNMIRQMNNIFDYDEYISKCKVNNIQIRDLSSFCVGIGTLMVGRSKYPELDWQEAYLKAFHDSNEQDEEEINLHNSIADNSCCNKKNKKPLGLIATGKNLISATKEYVSKGMSNVSHEEHLRRLAVCKDCEWIKDGFQCGQCHCFMGIKAGWDIKDSCKLNKW